MGEDIKLDQAEEAEVNKSKGNPSIQLLTDDIILQFSENNVLTQYRDINLKIDTWNEPYPNGVYDKFIFGSLYCDRCNCGTIKTPGIRCPRCGSMVLDEVQSFRHYARIESPVYYVTRFKLTKVIKFLKNNFAVVSDFKTENFEGYSWSDPKVLDICQWDWDAENESLIISDNITDFRKCSYEGLVRIISTVFPDRLTELRSYLNQYIIVIPMALRAPVPRVEDGKRKLDNHIITNVYKCIIYSIYEYYNNVFPSMKSESAKAIFRGCLRKMISTSLDQLSQLMMPSKENLARSMQSNRLVNSARLTIVPDPTLKADEITVPRFVMYEISREEFIPYLAEKMNISEKEAEVISRTQPELDVVQDWFTKFIEGDPKDPDSAKYILINRQPTLYELGMCTCKVKLTNDYCMKLPLVLCSPFNADFDGDTMALYDIPKKLNMVMNSTMSPRNQFYYKKSHDPLYTPRHDSMMGLLTATKRLVPEDNKLVEFEDLDEAKEYKKNNRNFKYQTICKIAGKETTLGRAILSELFDKDIDAYLEMVHSESINSKNINLLFEQLREYPDRLDRIRDIQLFSTKIATLSGETAPRLSELYIDIDQSYLDKIKSIENDPNIEPRAKELAIRDIYEEYQKVELDKIPEGVKTAITESSRAKINQLRDMAIQQLNVGPNRRFSVGETTLVQGLSPIDLTNHAIENRAIQDIKQQSVPGSGYLTRQFVYLASEFYFVDGSDEKNKGILIKMKDAEGRTKLDGSIVEKSTSDEEIMVRSIITSTLDKGKVTADMIPNMFTYKPGARVGMSMITSLTEGLTQNGLALKHDGKLFRFNPEDSALSPEDGTVEVTDNWVIFHGVSGNNYKYPKCDELVINYSPNNNYKKGQKFMTNYHSVTPSYKLDSIIRLCQARPVNGHKAFQNNRKLVSECYAITDGTIRYEMGTDSWVRIFIRDEEYEWNSDAMYLYPEGTELKKYQRFCSGTLNMKSYIYKVPDYVDLYYFFRNQFNELMPGLSSELIEFTYTLLVSNDGEQNDMRSVMQTIHGSDSFFKSLAFGDARKTFDKIDYKGMEFVADPITSVILSLIVNNEIK